MACTDARDRKKARLEFAEKPKLGAGGDMRSSITKKMFGGQRAPWVEALNKAIHLGGTKNRRLIKANKYFQLATTAPDGRPHCRTIVFRGFHKGCTKYSDCAMTFITDSRTEKIADLKANRHAELCCWISGANTQFRIAGEMSVLKATDNDSDPQDEKIRAEFWERLPRHTTAFCTGGDPGKPLNSQEEGGGEQKEPEAASKGQQGHVPSSSSVELSSSDVAPHKNFAVLVLEPTYVDQLRLGGNQARWKYTLVSEEAEGGGGPHWKTEKCVP